MKIGVIGNGFVGNAVAQFFKMHLPTVVWDKDKTRCTGTFQKTIESDFVFLCLPTPTNEDWSQDTTAIYDVLDTINQKPCDSILILKSTILPGTTQKLTETYPNLKLCYNPEFLMAKTAVYDFANPTDIVIGIGEDATVNQKVYDLYKTYFPTIPILTCNYTTAEMIKYTRNTFLATKVAFFNEIYLLCQTLGVDYNTVREGVIASVRINPTHTQVPGPDGHFGFGGACFPKDTKALAKFGKQIGSSDMLILKAALEFNKIVRKE
jgi:UDPglucose 6-dehydrogenase